MANLSNINGKFVVEQATGFVGIGTTDPNFLIEAAGTNAELALNASSIYRIRSTAGDEFIITKNGVGDRLTISGGGDATFAGSITVQSGNKLILNRPNNAIDCELSTDSAGTLILNSRNGEGFDFQNAGTQVVKINDSGVVKIQGSENTLLRLLSDDANVFLELKDNSSTNGNFIGTIADTMPFYTNNTLALTLDASQNATFVGKVIIQDNTSQPLSSLFEGTLAVQGASNQDPIIAVTDVNTANAAAGVFHQSSTSPGFPALVINAASNGDEQPLISARTNVNNTTGVGGTEVFAVDGDGDATFAGTLTVEGDEFTLGDGAYQTVLFDTSPSSVIGTGTMEIQPTTAPGSGTANFTTYFKDKTGGGTTKHNIKADGNATFAGTVSSGDITIAVDDTPTINFKKASSADVLGIINVTTDAGTGGKMAFQTKRNGNTAIDALVIDDDQNATFAGNVLLNGYLSVEGTSGNTGGASDRWIGGDGTAGTWFYNVPTGSQHLFGINNSNVLTLNATSATFAGDVAFQGTTNTYSGVVGQHPKFTQYAGLWNTKGQANNADRYMILNAAEADAYRTYITGDEVYIRPGQNNTTGQLIIRTTGSTFSATVDAAGYRISGSTILSGVSHVNLGSTGSTGNITLRTTSGSILNVVSDKVGIGTTSPGAKLDVGGDARVGNVASNSSTTNFETKLIVKGKNNYSDGTNWFGDYGQIILDANSNMTGSARKFMITNALNNNKFAIIRSADANTDPVTDSTASGVNSGTADFVITNSGEIGIGTTAPDTKLDVNGATFVRNVLFTYAGAGNQYAGLSWNNPDNGFLFLKASNVTKVNINSSGVSYFNGGDVGIGTTTPSGKLEVNGNNYNTNTITTFTLRDLGNNYGDGDNSIDIVMRSRYWSGDQNTSQNSRIRHLKDNSNGSTGTMLQFGTTTEGAGDASTKMTIKANGYVGIGTTSPGYTLEVNGTANIVSHLSAHCLGVGTAAPAQNGVIRAAGDIIAYYSSDKKLKDNIVKIEKPLEKLDKINGYEFDWNDKQKLYEGHDVGVVAQEVEEVYPELVETRKNGYKAVKYEKLVPLLVESIKELKNEIEQLKKQIK